MENVKNNVAVPQSLSIATKILEVINNRSKNTCNNWIKMLDSKYNLIELLINSCDQYEKILCKQAKGNEDISHACFTGKYLHSQNIFMRFSFLGKLLKLGTVRLTIGRENIAKLRAIYIDNEVPEFDTKQFLIWLCSEIKLKELPNTIFNVDEVSYLFSIMHESYMKLLNNFGLSYYYCFKRCFIIINTRLGSIEYVVKRIRTKQFHNIIGLENMWNCVCRSNKEEVRAYFNRLLLDTYTGFHESILVEDRNRIMDKFVDTCFTKLNGADSLTTSNILKLLSSLIDRIDGKDYEGQVKNDLKNNICLVDNISIISYL
jgi:hypothetical protein